MALISGDIEWLALAFRHELKRGLTPTAFMDIRRRNALPEYQVNACASHEFCDANEVMRDAFEVEFGRSLNLDDEADVALIDAAWDLAQREYLTAWEEFQG
jgi:hypothetical protein